ncbi:hypothetical protein CRG98_002919 [Punica granatum]|uniref:Uncharacterized protein n=1 Tax=Punica granatum TaxID=22663 RepID=A0A2I0L7K2_PUNGR|nr:hypothetical protein CRG98_002919 [Punica granatum]
MIQQRDPKISSPSARSPDDLFPNAPKSSRRQRVDGFRWDLTAQTIPGNYEETTPATKNSANFGLQWESEELRRETEEDEEGGGERQGNIHVTGHVSRECVGVGIRRIYGAGREGWLVMWGPLTCVAGGARFIYSAITWPYTWLIVDQSASTGTKGVQTHSSPSPRHVAYVALILSLMMKMQLLESARGWPRLLMNEKLCWTRP